jgi:hypothetical protein
MVDSAAETVNAVIANGGEIVQPIGRGRLSARSIGVIHPDRARPRGAWVGYAAALWALVFTFLHVVWAAGWYVGLPEAEARWSFSRHWFLVYDLIIAGLCALAVPVALALVLPWGRRLPRRLVSLLAWSGTGLLVLRGGGGALQVGYWVVTEQYAPRPMHIYEIWFCLGAVLFGASLSRFRRTPSDLASGAATPSAAAAGRDSPP